MKRFLLAAALAAAVPFSVHAQENFDPSGGQDAVASPAEKIRTLSKKMAPAPVEAEPIEALTRLLAAAPANGPLHELSRQTAPDARGRYRVIRAGLIELGVKESPGYQDLVQRSELFSLQAASEEWIVDAKTGTGRREQWLYVLSFDGRLLQVEHSTAPVGHDVSGTPVVNPVGARSNAVSPSDAGVQKRWKALSKQLLTLGPLAEI